MAGKKEKKAMFLKDKREILDYLPIRFGRTKILAFLAILAFIVFVVIELNDIAWVAVLLAFSLLIPAKHFLFSGLSIRQWFKKFWRNNVKGCALWCFRDNDGRIVYHLIRPNPYRLGDSDGLNWRDSLITFSIRLNKGRVNIYTGREILSGKFSRLFIPKSFFHHGSFWLKLDDSDSVKAELPLEVLMKIMEVNNSIFPVYSFPVFEALFGSLEKLLPTKQLMAQDAGKEAVNEEKTQTAQADGVIPAETAGAAS